MVVITLFFFGCSKTDIKNVTFICSGERIIGKVDYTIDKRFEESPKQETNTYQLIDGMYENNLCEFKNELITCFSSNSSDENELVFDRVKGEVKEYRTYTTYRVDNNLPLLRIFHEFRGKCETSKGNKF